MLESRANDFVAAGSLGRRGRLGLAVLLGASTLACVGLGGCASAAPDGRAGLDARFGTAVAHNMEAQFVAPTPEQKANTYIPPNPARQRLAVDTYEAGEVELDSVGTE